MALFTSAMKKMRVYDLDLGVGTSPICVDQESIYNMQS